MNTGIDPETGQAPMFASPAGLREAFERKLSGLLDQDVLGVFILVLANASFERATLDRLRTPLAHAFDRWSGRFERADERAVGAAPDDVAVFLRLREIGLDGLAVTFWRNLGPWELQFNQLRALRPPRMSDAAVTGLRRAFDPHGFHFNKPFLREEIFWEGELAGTPVRWLFNKFPFAQLHGLLVPDPEAGRPQFLTEHYHFLAWEIAQRLGGRLPGIGLAYNASGAYASVNHLHFQTFMRTSGVYPIESSRWLHNGGDELYALPVQRHADRAEAWRAIHELHAAGRSYNLVYRPGCLYIVERAMQGSYMHSAWTSGFAWSEASGSVTVSDEADFERLSAADIEAEFARLAVTA